MTTRQVPKLLSTSVTSTLKKSGLYCEAGSFRTGGFAARQINEWRGGYKVGVDYIVVRFQSGWMMNSPADARIKATEALVAKGYRVAVRGTNELIVTAPKEGK